MSEIINYPTKYATVAVFGEYASKFAYEYVTVPLAVLQSSERALVDAGIVVRKSGPWTAKSSMRKSSQYGWAPMYSDLGESQRNALFLLVVAETMKAVPPGTAQAALDKLVAERPPLPVDSSGKPIVDAQGRSIALQESESTPWLLYFGLAAAAVGGVYYASRKRRKKRR